MHTGTISPVSPLSDCSTPMLPWCGGAAVVTQTWPLANQAIGYPFQVNETVTVYEAWYTAGATAGGNLDLGIFNLAGNLIVDTGTIARVVSAHTNVALTDTTLTPGHYYACMTADSTATYGGWVAANGGINEAMGIIEFTDATPFATTATFSRSTRVLLPNFGFNYYSLAL